jgi:hypothetical protein
MVLSREISRFTEALPTFILRIACVFNAWTLREQDQPKMAQLGAVKQANLNSRVTTASQIVPKLA